MPRRHEGTNLDLGALFEMSVDQPKMVKEASTSRLKFADTGERFKKIALDLYRDSESEFIWKLEKDSETGEEFIMRTASVDPQHVKKADWTAEIDTNKKSITVAYKGQAIKAFKKAELNFTDETVEDWRNFILKKLNTDEEFGNKVVANLSDQRKRYIVGKYPELQK